MKAKPPLERIFRVITEVDGCWIWGRGFSNGYPCINIDGRSVGVHRFLFQQMKGGLRRGVRINSTCSSAACVLHWGIEGSPADPFVSEPAPGAVAEVFAALQEFSGRGREPMYASIGEQLKANSKPTSNGCIHWTGSIIKNGYGQMHVGGKTRKAHIVAYEEEVGPVPEGMVLDHQCHNQDPDCDLGDDCLHRRCINTDHLEPATQRENSLRGKTLAARNAAKTHCDNDHEFTEENTYWRKGGGRHCRTCLADHDRERKAKKKHAHDGVSAATDQEKAA